MHSSVDAKSLRDLEVKKSCHGIVLVITEESLGLIQKHYSIPEEYVLRAPLSEQCPYNPKSSELSISVDALEAGLHFSLHPTIVEYLRWWRISPSQVAPNSWRYLIGECDGSYYSARNALDAGREELFDSSGHPLPIESGRSLHGSYSQEACQDTSSRAGGYFLTWETGQYDDGKAPVPLRRRELPGSIPGERTSCSNQGGFAPHLSLTQVDEGFMRHIGPQR
ncbi:hypothetical protein BHM03_00054087 [Ensete ventricosum]|uniref:Uncharacterized protein n=1 Tax=Ensete ventricosum TaxID=4639 RepID=A0A445MM33_ENSVE|nr:hypothetical protein BHM03_00054087 [Ensete ventricosum]